MIRYKRFRDRGAWRGFGSVELGRWSVGRWSVERGVNPEDDNEEVSQVWLLIGQSPLREYSHEQEGANSED